MAVTADRFLNQFFMQMRFNQMCASYPEKFKTFKKYIDSGDYKFRGDMELWKDRLYHPDNDGKQIQKLTDGKSGEWEMDDDAWKELYLEFNNAMRTMFLNKKSFDNPNDEDNYNGVALMFLNDNFGADKIFSFSSATPEAVAKINELATYLAQSDIQAILDVAFRNWGYKDLTCKKLLDGINNRKYNTDNDFKENLLSVVREIHYRKQNQFYDETDRKYFEDLSQKGFQFRDFEDILNGFNDKNVDTTKLNDFKEKYQDLLQIVGTNKKLQKQFNSAKITAALDNAKAKVAYDDKNSDSFLEDSKNDKKTLWQEIQDWSKNTYSDVFEKYKLLQGDRLYFSPQAKDIIGELNGKTKPTDGLDGILKVASDVKSNLQKKSFASAKYFDWMTKTLGEIKNVKPKAFEGALRNGTQLEVVVEELIRRAVRDSENGDKNAIDAAKAALEVISVSKYGLTTSKIMDALSDEFKNFALFSDSNLSWNKNEFTAMVTSAMDKSLVFVMKGIGYGTTMLVNTINKMGSKFNGKRKGLSKISSDWEDENAEAKRTAEQNRDNYNSLDNTEISNQQNIINNTGITNLDTEKQKLKNQRQDEKDKKLILEQAKTVLENAETALNQAIENSMKEIGKYKQEKSKESQKQEDINQANDNISAKQDELQRLQDIINDYNNMPAENQKLKDDIAKKGQRLRQIRDALKKISVPYKNAAHEARANQLQQQYLQEKAELQNDINKWREQVQKYNTRNTPGSEYMNTINEIPNVNAEISAAQNALTAAQTALATAQRATAAAKNQKDSFVQIAHQAKQDFNDAKIAYKDAEQEYQDAQNISADTAGKIEQFEDAEKRIEELNRHIEERKKTVDTWDEKHKNQYDELIAYWDFLETGRDARMGPFYNRWRLSKKKAQKVFDTKKVDMFQDFKNKYSYAA